MTRLRVRTSSRIHFGLLGWGPGAGRQFGGVGLMIEDPGLVVEFDSSPRWEFSGPLASRVEAIVRSSLESLKPPYPVEAPRPSRVEVVSHAPEHAGLGVGTQLSLAVVAGLSELIGLPSPNAERLAGITGRARRSGVGLHGFLEGGLIVDGGHAAESPYPPLIARASFPEEWSILLVQPPGPAGRHGQDEIRSFAELRPIPERITERMCLLVLLGILPAVAERNLDAFGAAVSELQHHVGESFAPVQGGHYTSPMSESIVADLASIGLVGIGQSSWGPTLYAFGQETDSERDRIRRRLVDRFGLAPTAVRWTRAANHGAVTERPEA